MDVYQNSSSIGLQHLRQAKDGVGVCEAGDDEGKHGEHRPQPHPGHPRTLLVAEQSALLLHVTSWQFQTQVEDMNYRVIFGSCKTVDAFESQ